MRSLLLGILFAALACAQSLPGTVVSGGMEWDRYAAAGHFSANVSASFQVGKTNWYSYSTVTTPVAKTPEGQNPQTSSIRSGFFYVVTQSGGVSFAALAQAGVSVAQGTSTQANISGGVAVPIRLGKTNLYAIPLLRFVSPQTGTGVQVVPEIQIGYGFGGK